MNNKNCKCNCSAHRQDEPRREMAGLVRLARGMTATGVGSIALLGTIFLFDANLIAGFVSCLLLTLGISDLLYLFACHVTNSEYK